MDNQVTNLILSPVMNYFINVAMSKNPDEFSKYALNFSITSVGNLIVRMEYKSLRNDDKFEIGTIIDLQKPWTSARQNEISAVLKKKLNLYISMVDDQQSKAKEL